MEEHIREDKVLEFKALTMAKPIFEQLREVRDEEAKEAKLIGWVYVGSTEWFIGKLGNQLIQICRTEVFDRMIKEIGCDEINKRARSAGIGPGAYSHELDKLRDSLPQIFLK